MIIPRCFTSILSDAPYRVLHFDDRAHHVAPAVYVNLPIMASIRRVCLLGADGTLGPSILQALIDSNFTVTVLKRSSSKSPDNYPPGVITAKVDEKFAVDDLASVLEDQDALVVTIKGTQVDVQKRLADACVKANVKRLIPADFGSCDSSSDHAQDCVPLFGNKTELRSYLDDLVSKHPSFTYTSLVSGHFFDWDPAFLHIWPKERRAELLDAGDVKASYSTLARVGQATARVLQLPAETANKTLFVQSFCVTQQQITRSFERASGGLKWAVTPYDSVEYEREQKAKRDGGDKDAIENLVWLLGALESNWEKKDGFAMNLLGLQNESLDDAVAKIWKEHQ